MEVGDAVRVAEPDRDDRWTGLPAHARREGGLSEEGLRAHVEVPS